MYKNFTGESLNYNLEKYNFSKWALDRIQIKFPEVTDLETIHETVDVADIGSLQHWVSSGCETLEFMEMLDNFLVENIKPLVDTDFLIQRFGTLRVVIPNQEKVGRLLNYHQGIFVGNGTGLRTVWTPFTKCWGSNTMHMVNLDISREITKRCISEKWSQEFFNAFSEKHSYDINLEPGQSWLFNQELIHGNVNNDTGVTRVSMDLRIVLKDGNYGRKYPGQYFRTLFDWKESKVISVDTSQTFVTYAGWNSSYTKHLPLVLQRSFMDNYIKKHKITINEYSFENEYLDYLPNLQYLTGKVDNVILLSIYALPDDPDDRQKIYNLALDNQCNLHFSQEDIILTSEKDIKIIETYLTWGESYKDWSLNV
jgi:sporadic carbohydrate cluster 2OG-Fe(II) oxygenase/sporadic carbohydrate cluster protein (TIGR04323 family)